MGKAEGRCGAVCGTGHNRAVFRRDLHLPDGFLCPRRRRLPTAKCFVFGADRIVDEDAVSSFLYELYSVREYIPKEILLDFPLCDDSRNTLSDLLREKAGYRVNVRFPGKRAISRRSAAWLPTTQRNMPQDTTPTRKSERHAYQNSTASRS